MLRERLRRFVEPTPLSHFSLPESRFSFRHTPWHQLMSLLHNPAGREGTLGLLAVFKAYSPSAFSLVCGICPKIVPQALKLPSEYFGVLVFGGAPLTPT